MERIQLNTLLLDDGWDLLQLGNNLQGIIENQQQPVSLFSLEENKNMTPESQFPPHEYTTLDTIIYKRYRQQLLSAQQLNEKNREIIEEYIKKMVVPSLEEKHGEFLLSELVKRWGSHEVMVRWLSRFFSYPYGHFMSLPELKEAGPKCFRDLVYVVMKMRLLDMIDQLRKGELEDKEMLKKTLDIFVEIGWGKMHPYEKDFEESMLNNISIYYSIQSSKWITDETLPNYLKKLDECLEQEKNIADYLHLSSKAKILETVHHELLSVHATQLLRPLLKDDKGEDLSSMFVLFSSFSGGLDHASKFYEQYVTSEGKALQKEALRKSKDPKKRRHWKVGFVKKLIGLLEKHLTHVDKYFQSHFLFYEALLRAFKLVCNAHVAGISGAELFATFFDYLLKGSSERFIDEANDTLKKALILLTNIEDKDKFAEIYMKNLSRRLLFGANIENERRIITKMTKHLCLVDYEAKAMKRMVTDFESSSDTQSKFVEYLGKNPNANLGMHMTMTVLNEGLWRNLKLSDFNPPADLVECERVNRDFYEKETAKETRWKKKLTFLHDLGTCEVDGNFDEKQILLDVTTVQAAVLLLFNDSERLHLKDIMTELNISEDHAVSVLRPLSHGKYTILTKEPDTIGFSPSDMFTFNSRFTDTENTIKIPRPRVDIFVDVKKKTKLVFLEDFMDAAIVRIMKRNRVLGHLELVKELEEVFDSKLDFKPDSIAIQKRIGRMIERGYMERDEENVSKYKYLA